ncbi:AAA family ATPase [Paenibacillus polymyxa]|uniref:AAA family ATPase n=1 Tax=Paenibacillus polymyxa TaxID=1406 RepID=UPI001BEAFBFC|nr:AAA family ATPase [Paenibacillus polymyxa]MBT2285175.1 AAA family ATPase [Paenibacillus polymyxa]
MSSYIIKSLKLNNERYKRSETSSSLEWLENLTKINIFVGSNNSGKSQMLRNIFKTPTLEFVPNDLELIQLNALQTELVGEVEAVMSRNRATEYGGIMQAVRALTDVDWIVEDTDVLERISATLERLINITNNESFESNARYTGTGHYGDFFKQPLQEIGKEYMKKLQMIVGNETKRKYHFDNVYIPTLRGLRPYNATGDDFYSERTKKDYFQSETKGSVFSGLSLYDQLRSMLLGNLEEREKVARYQEFLGDTFFNGEKVVLLPAIHSDVVIVKIGDEKEMPIYNLGDGIQSIIILTFPLYAHLGENLLVFIEEPELYLHPGLQRKLIETFLRDEFSGYQFFLTTHSNHFLDITLDVNQISIYSFKKELASSEEKEKQASFVIENVSNEDNSLLEMLGVKNSSVYLSNCTVWVEGITDRFYVRRYLKLYQDHLNISEKDRFKEDYHYSFVEYSGNNITHWSFLDDNSDEIFKSMNVDRLCSRLFLITDKDSEKKLSRQEKLKARLGERFYCLESKEIENTLTADIVKKVIADYEKSNVDSLSFNQNFETNTYQNKYLGRFIDNVLTDSKRKGGYASESGTIKEKVKFSEKAIGHLEEYSNLSEDAKRLAERLFQFIRQNNISLL